MKLNNKGITLIEMIAVIIIFSLVMSALYSSLSMILNMSKAVNIDQENISDVTLFLNTLSNSFDNIKFDTSTSCGSNCVLFTKNGYYSVNENLEKNYISSQTGKIYIEKNTIFFTNNDSIINSIEVSEKSTITTSCIISNCSDAVIELKIIRDRFNENSFEVLSFLAH
ncbi:MAG: type II secretion system protein J [Bacilli bacterium]